MNLLDLRSTSRYEKRRLLLVAAIALGALALCGTAVGSSSTGRDGSTNCSDVEPRDARLCATAEFYARVAARGGWPTVPDGPPLLLGHRGRRVAALRSRLWATSDLRTSNSAASDSFGSTLEEAVRTFQRRHGLRPDGTVGPRTLNALNAPVEDRIRQIQANLERRREQSSEPTGRALLLNAADFRLDLVEMEDTVRSMRAIVGRSSRPTPIVSGNITQVVLSPYWHVPHRLAVQDQLPLIRGDPEQLSRLGMRVFAADGDAEHEIDPATVDWATVSPSNFPFRLRQDPGPLNALGTAKFLFPNRFGVTLHGTPDGSLFDENRRAFSSGCVRIEDPLALAEILLRDQPEWTREKMDEVVDSREERVVDLSEPVAIVLSYWTAWVDRAGRVQFREDIYGRDATVAPDDDDDLR